MSPFSLQDKHIVVIGGTSGIGLSVARLALRAEARVTVVGRSKDKLSSLQSEFKTDRLQIIACDVLADLTPLKAISQVDHLFISAGKFVGGSFQESSLDTIHEALGRLFAAVNSVRALEKELGAKSSIVLTGGVSTDRPVKGAWATAVSTAATEQLARSLALELAPRRVNAIAPGWTDTPMWDSILGGQKEKAFTEVASKIPTGKIASSEEAALAVIALMLNPGISGEVLHIDGGHRLT